MVTVAHMTKKILQEKPFIHEALEKGLVNLGALAEMIQPDIEKELGKVKTTAISMAIRRYMEKNDEYMYRKVKFSFRTSLVVKSDLFEISLSKSQTVHKKLSELYNVVNFESNDTLNIINGNYEILVIGDNKYQKKFLEILKGEKIKSVIENVSSISLRIPDENFEIPGFYYTITKTLALENISIIDLVNTETEATLILDDKDIGKAYEMLKREISFEYYKKDKRR